MATAKPAPKPARQRILCQKHEALIKERCGSRTGAVKAFLVLRWRRDAKVREATTDQQKGLLPVCCHLGDAAVNAVIQERPQVIKQPGSVEQLTPKQLRDQKTQAEKARALRKAEAKE